MVLKVCREVDEVTSAGKLFHVRAAATGNARSPTVDSRVDGTSNADVDDDPRRCRQGILASGDRLKGVGQVGQSKSTNALAYNDDKLEKICVAGHETSEGGGVAE